MHKYTAVYGSPDDISNLKIRIRLGENDECVEEKTFGWQEKVFGKFERNFYREKRNCVTDLEKKYHGDVSKGLQVDCLLFSYVNEDEFDADSPDGEVMHLMADLSEFEPTVLCTVTYDNVHKRFTIHPDFTQGQPYSVQIETDTKRNYQYYVEDASERITLETQLKENEILNKITSHQLKVRSKKAGTDFDVPAKNTLACYLFCEILSGSNFEYGDVHVRYVIDLPESWSCKDASTLSGCTSSSHRSGLQHFGYPFEVHLECNLHDADAQAPCIFFEVISKDSWDRFRSEGVACAILPTSQPGAHNYELQCARTSPAGVETNLRRFFVGDFSSRSDFDWLAPRQNQRATINKCGITTTATGQINVRINVLQQAYADGQVAKKRTKFILEKLNTSGLVKSVEQVVAAFKIAKRKMMEAKKNV